MTQLDKILLIAKNEAGMKLTKKEQLKLKLYPNKENDIRINILKAQYGVSYNGNISIR